MNVMQHTEHQFAPFLLLWVRAARANKTRASICTWLKSMTILAILRHAFHFTPGIALPASVVRRSTPILIPWAGERGLQTIDDPVVTNRQL